MSKFIFKDYSFDKQTNTASFHYCFDDGKEFTEKVVFAQSGEYDEALLDRALFLAFLLAGTSYYKTFPSDSVELAVGTLDEWQATFFTTVYQEGMSQFAFENQLTRAELAHFRATTTNRTEPLGYAGQGIVALQSGGKDSLLTASLLTKNQVPFTPWYLAYSPSHPAVLDQLGSPLGVAARYLDKQGLSRPGALQGHVPITYIVAAYALIDAILNNKSTILISVGHEGEEAHDWIGDLPVNHQWSKTWSAEQSFAEYVARYITPGIKIGSPLRSFSELKIAELFVQSAWQEFGHKFSSCNLANYKQGTDNAELTWCGECPKCANSFLLFAPFLDAQELRSIFGSQDLFEKPLLQETFKGLLGIDGVMKPLECIGEVDELRLAYHMAQERGGYEQLPFEVPSSSFDYLHTYESQQWARELIQ